MTLTRKWWIAYWAACLLIGFVGGTLLSKWANSHEVHDVTVLRGTSEAYVVGPPRSSLPVPKATTQPVRRGLARSGRRR